MARPRIIIAALIAIVYVALVVGMSLIHFANTGNYLNLRLNIAQLSNWIIAIIGLLLAWGLWQRYAWAWWGGVAAAGFQLYRTVSWIVTHYSFSHLPGMHLLAITALLVAFLVLLLSPKAMASCNR
ncbi:MAG: hypothetical protein KGM99_00215 [Burkholderiales bacterium]|nr:hypothetical protein [Burkholderiales bacterium]